MDAMSHILYGKDGKIVRLLKDGRNFPGSIPVHPDEVEGFYLYDFHDPICSDSILKAIHMSIKFQERNMVRARLTMKGKVGYRGYVMRPIDRQKVFTVAFPVVPPLPPQVSTSK